LVSKIRNFNMVCIKKILLVLLLGFHPLITIAADIQKNTDTTTPEYENNVKIIRDFIQVIQRDRNSQHTFDFDVDYLNGIITGRNADTIKIAATVISASNITNEEKIELIKKFHFNKIRDRKEKEKLLLFVIGAGILLPALVFAFLEQLARPKYSPQNNLLDLLGRLWER
jgi:hypothetical protein